MKRLKLKRITVPALSALLVFGMIGLRSLAIAETSSQNAATVKIERSATQVSLDASDLPLEEAIQRLKDQSKATILVEPGIADKVTANIQGKSLEKALSILTEKGEAIWAKVDATTKKDESLPGSTLFDLARAIRAVSASSLKIEMPDRVGNLVVSASETLSSAAEPKPSPGENRVTVYLVAKKSPTESAIAANASPADQAIALRERQYEMMQSMAPQERQRVMQNEYLYMLNLPLATRMQMAMDQSAAFNNLPTEVKNQFMNMKRETGEKLSGSMPPPNKGEIPAGKTKEDMEKERQAEGK